MGSHKWWWRPRPTLRLTPACLARSLWPLGRPPQPPQPPQPRRPVWATSQPRPSPTWPARTRPGWSRTRGWFTSEHYCMLSWMMMNWLIYLQTPPLSFTGPTLWEVRAGNPEPRQRQHWLIQHWCPDLRPAPAEGQEGLLLREQGGGRPHAHLHPGAQDSLARAREGPGAVQRLL